MKIKRMDKEFTLGKTGLLNRGFWLVKQAKPAVLSLWEFWREKDGRNRKSASWKAGFLKLQK